MLFNNSLTVADELKVNHADVTPIVGNAYTVSRASGATIAVVVPSLDGEKVREYRLPTGSKIVDPKAMSADIAIAAQTAVVNSLIHRRSMLINKIETERQKVDVDMEKVNAWEKDVKALRGIIDDYKSTMPEEAPTFVGIIFAFSMGFPMKSLLGEKSDKEWLTAVVGADATTTTANKAVNELFALRDCQYIKTMASRLKEHDVVNLRHIADVTRRKWTKSGIASNKAKTADVVRQVLLTVIASEYKIAIVKKQADYALSGLSMCK